MTTERVLYLLSLSDEATYKMKVLAVSLLTCFSVTACIWSNFRLILLGEAQDIIQWALRLVLCLTLLQTYDEVFFFLVKASGAVAQHLQEAMPGEISSDRLQEEIRALGQPPVVNNLAGRISGQGWGSPLRWVADLVRGLNYIANEAIVISMATSLSVMRVAGPLMIAAGIFSGSGTLHSWLKNVFWICLWPVPPACVAFMLHNQQFDGSSTNSLFLAAQSLILGFFTLMSPKVSSFLMGQGGFEGMTNWATGTVSQGLGSAVRSMAPGLARKAQEGTISGLSASGSGLRGLGQTGQNAAHNLTRAACFAGQVSTRPGDQIAFQAAQQALHRGSQAAPQGPPMPKRVSKGVS